MSQMLVLGGNALVGRNVVGKLTKDADGYYHNVVVGALECFCERGNYYPSAPVKDLFVGSSELQRRIGRNCLRGELGHPRREPGMSQAEWLARVSDIHEHWTSHNIVKLELDDSLVKDDRGPVVSMLAKIKPSGPQAQVLERIMSDPQENACFSLRGFSVPKVNNGRNERLWSKIITWDYVNEPGIRQATKYHSPTLLGFSEITVTKALIEEAIEITTAHGADMQSDSGLLLLSVRDGTDWDRVNQVLTQNPKSTKNAWQKW